MDRNGELNGSEGTRNGVEKYMPFDVENRIDGEKNESSNDVSVGDSKSEVSAANVLKTLFFILVWYTFSLFLTL